MSPPKSAVLRDLLTEHPVVFWGYSGADLKLDLDYLQMVTAAPSSPGFLWNLHATPTWKEPPNRYVDELVELYGGRGVVCHEDPCDALAPVVGVKPEPPEAEDVDDLRTRRGAQLSRALQEWAGRSVRQEHAFEIFGRLFERAGEVQPALECYQLLADRAFAEHKRALTALAYARGGDLLSRMGQFEQADDALRLADDHARSAGALDLDLMVARTRGRLFSMEGRLLPAVQPLGFGRLISTWRRRRWPRRRLASTLTCRIASSPRGSSTARCASSVPPSAMRAPVGGSSRWRRRLIAAAVSTSASASGRKR